MADNRSPSKRLNPETKILALITARGGSKRLPGKNLRLLGGIPLIAWTVRCALASGACTRVLVSTDSGEIAKASCEAGAEAPWLRPAELATDEAGSIDVICHALNAERVAGRNYDAVVLLQPTSPFRRPETLHKAVQEFLSHTPCRPLVSVSPVREHPSWVVTRDAEGHLTPILGERGPHRAQELVNAYVYNGALYIADPTALLSGEGFIKDSTYGFVMDDPVEGLDIDDSFDWLVAETALANGLTWRP